MHNVKRLTYDCFIHSFIQVSLFKSKQNINNIKSKQNHTEDSEEKAEKPLRSVNKTLHMQINWGNFTFFQNNVTWHNKCNQLGLHILVHILSTRTLSHFYHDQTAQLQLIFKGRL